MRRMGRRLCGDMDSQGDGVRMKLLIVDDNKYVVEGLKRQLNWSILGIDKVLGCYRVEQAKDILCNEKIDFLISDIEMPGQSGFELLEWIKEQEMDIETVLLTSYADFTYAQSAVRYQCFQYLLKPVETSVLKDVCCQMVEKRIAHLKEKQMVEYGNNWLSHQNIVKEMFWRDVMEEAIPGREDAVLRWIRKENLPYEINEDFALVLICFEPDREKESWSRELLGFSSENVLSEITRETGVSLEGLCYNGHFQFAVVFHLPKGEGMELMIEAISRFHQVFSKYYSAGIQCYLSECCHIMELIGHLHRLEEIHLDHLGRKSGIYLEQDYEDRAGNESLAENKYDSHYQAPEIEEWRDFLLNGSIEMLEMHVQDYFAELKREEKVNHKQLQAVLADWNLLVYGILREHNITTYHFITHFRDQELLELSSRSINCLEQLILKEAGKIAEQVRYVEKADVIINDIKKYIKEHLEEVTRSEISEAFYLSPNYLSKFFRKETGISLSEYIQNERMDLAKRLLLQEKLSISQIAIETGYPSFAHFSKQFKKFVGMTPNEYRKMYLLNL